MSIGGCTGFFFLKVYYDIRLHFMLPCICVD